MPISTPLLVMIVLWLVITLLIVGYLYKYKPQDDIVEEIEDSNTEWKYEEDEFES